MAKRKKEIVETKLQTTEEAFPHFAGICCADEMIEVAKYQVDNGLTLTLWKCRWCNGRDWSF